MSTPRVAKEPETGLLIALLVTGLSLTGCGDSGTGPGGGNGGGSGGGGSRPTVAVVDSAYFPTDVVVHNGALYWLDASTEPLNKIDLVTHAHTAVIQVIPHPESAVSDGNFVYWVSGGGLYRTSLDGTITTLFDQGERDVVSGVTSAVVFDAENLYWANTTATGNCSPACNFSIRRVPKAGGPATTLTTTTQPIVALAIQKAELYWEEVEHGTPTVDGTVGSQVKKIPVVGGSVTVLVNGLLNGLIAPPGPAYTPASWHPTGGLAVDDSTVYFADASYYQSYRVMKTPTAGGGATPTIMAADTTGDASDFARSLVLDQDHVYWVDLNSLKVMAKTGGGFSDLASNLTSPLSLVRLGGNLYWVEAVCCAHKDKGTIKRMPTSGGTPVTLRSDIPSPTSIAADQAALFWVEGGMIGAIEGFGGISRIGLDGTGELTLVTAAKGGTFAVDDAYLYFADAFTIKRVAVNGGPVQRLATTDFYVRSLATDGAYVYWDEDPVTVVHRVPVNGGAIETVSLGSGPAGTVRVDRSYVYWLDHIDTIRRAPKTGGSAETIAGPVSGGITDFVVSGSQVYYAEWDGHRIMRTAVSGGTAAPLADTHVDQTRRLASDGVNVYWVDQVEIEKVAVGGGDPFIISPNNGSDPFLVGGIAVDDHSVYWAEPDGWVIKVARPK